MATVTKNFRIKSGLIVEGTTGTINGQNILTETGGNAYILNLVGGATLVKSVDTGVFNVDGSGNLTVNANTFDSYGSASDAQAAAELTAAGDATTKANAAQAAAITAAATDATTKVAAEAALRVSGDAASVSTASADATSKANAAQAAAEATASADATSKAATAKSEAIAAAATDATTKAAAAQAAAEATAAAALSSAISTEVTNRNTAISAAVDNLVDDAPGLLDTLNELAAAINDDANYATTMTTALAGKANASDVTTSLAGKQDTLTAGSNIDITGSTISVTGLDTADVVEDASRLYFTNQRAIDAGDGVFDGFGAAAAAQTAAEGFATTAANNAQDAAESYADSLASNYDAVGSAALAQSAAETTALNYVSDVLDGTSAFTEINVNDLVSQRAAQGLVATAQTGSSMMSWAKTEYGTAKAWVKFATATHSQISEFLLTTDSSGNIAITEFGMVTSNGTLGSVGASYLNGNIAIEVDTVHANTTVTVVATLIK